MYLDTQTPPEKTEKMTGLVEISNMLRWPDAAKSHKENLWNIHSPLKRSPQHRALMYSPKAVTGWREVNGNVLEVGSGDAVSGICQTIGIRVMITLRGM